MFARTQLTTRTSLCVNVKCIVPDLAAWNADFTLCFEFGNRRHVRRRAPRNTKIFNGFSANKTVDIALGRHWHTYRAFLSASPLVPALNPTYHGCATIKTYPSLDHVLPLKHSRFTSYGMNMQPIVDRRGWLHARMNSAAIHEYRGSLRYAYSYRNIMHTSLLSFSTITTSDA